MKLKKIKIKTKSQEYSIIVGFDVISKIKKIIYENSIEFKKCLLIVDKKVPKKFINILKKKLQNKELYFYLFDANEKNKNQKTINYILDILLKRNFSRKDCIIAMGGGITGDVGGFAASIFKRGMQFINIPTTLLSQVDSSIGGKTGINSKHGKNLIGSFYQPNLVIGDSKFLKSLPKREINCGYAEILKHSLISNKKFFKFLKKNVIDILNIKSPLLESAIYESCKIKKLIVEKDEKEKNLRKVLNFGHTFAHAFEATLGYSKKLNHGEAVSLGIKTAIEFSYRKKLIKAKEYIAIKNHIKKSNLPYDLKKYFSLKDLNKILSFMTKDKKNYSNKINLILLKSIGRPIINGEYYKNNLKLFLKKELVN